MHTYTVCLSWILVWPSDIAGAPRVQADRQWAYNGTTRASFGSGKISVLFWLDHLLSALRGEYSIHDGKQQGLFLRQLIEGPSSPNSPARSRNYRSFAAPRSSARPPSITIRTRTMPWPATTRLRTRSATPARSLATRWTVLTSRSALRQPTTASPRQQPASGLLTPSERPPLHWALPAAYHLQGT